MNQDIVDLQNQLRQLGEQVAALVIWQKQRMNQQITSPLDQTSRNLLQVVTEVGFGSTAVTHNVSIPSTPTSITVPTNPTGTILLDTGNGVFEIPHY